MRVKICHLCGYRKSSNENVYYGIETYLNSGVPNPDRFVSEVVGTHKPPYRCGVCDFPRLKERRIKRSRRYGKKRIITSCLIDDFSICIKEVPENIPLITFSDLENLSGVEELNFDLQEEA